MFRIPMPRKLTNQANVTRQCCFSRPCPSSRVRARASWKADEGCGAGRCSHFTQLFASVEVHRSLKKNSNSFGTGTKFGHDHHETQNESLTMLSWRPGDLQFFCFLKLGYCIRMTRVCFFAQHSFRCVGFGRDITQMKTYNLLNLMTFLCRLGENTICAKYHG